MRRKIIGLIILMILGIGSNSSALAYKTMITQKSTNKEKMTDGKIEKELEKENQQEKFTEVVEEKVLNIAEDTGAVEENKFDISKDTETVESSSSNSHVITNSNESNSISNVVPNNDFHNTLPVQHTEWAKLGISEYDYYHSPAPNEGEIAFRDSEEKCSNVANEITSKYGFITHFGDIYSYAESYIGCWITVHLVNGDKMFYNEFKLRENRGEFSTNE